MINDRIDAFLLHSLPKLRLAVLGDVMVDRYIFGDVSRISPEAPVPVNLVSSIKEVLGGCISKIIGMLIKKFLRVNVMPLLMRNLKNRTRQCV